MFRIFRVGLMSCFCAAFFAAPLHAQPLEAPGTAYFPVNQEAFAVYTKTPRQTVRYFLDIYNSGNPIKDLAPLVVGGDLGDPALEKLQAEYEKIRLPLAIQMDSFKEKIDGNRAQVEATFLVTNDWDLAMRWIETLQLQREKTEWGEGWRIAPGEAKITYDASDNYVKRLATFVAHPKPMLNLLAVDKSMRQVKLLLLGLTQYLQDHDSLFPATLASVPTEIQPYVRDENLWTASGDTRGAQSYSFNSQLVSRDYSKLENTNKIVMVYLGQNGKLDFRFDGFSVVGFVDGHVEYVNAEQAKNLRWTP